MTEVGSDVYNKVYERFKTVVNGRKNFAALQSPTEAPSWLDKEKCKRGRDFFFGNMAAISVSSMEALILGMCIPNFYRPLVLTKKSHLKEDALARYKETAVFLYSWYLDDCWENESYASKMLKRVNNMHRFVAKKVRPINEDLPDKVEQLFRESQIYCDSELDAQDKIMLDDIAAIRESIDIPQEYYDYVNDSEAFSQTDMQLVQGAFFGQFVLYPSHYGGKNVSKEELESFLMFWRVNGYYLGIDDAYNAVLDNLGETKIMAELMLEKILKPCMLHLNPEAIHMAKAALFPSMDYHVVLYSKYELVGFDLPNLWKSFSLAQKAKYYLREVYIPHVYPLPIIKDLINMVSKWLLDHMLSEFQKKGPKAFKS